jgi:ABC-type antimicrobial peptide transport system permease subunit
MPASRLIDWLGPIRAVVALVVALGLVTVALTVLGVFGVVSFFVGLRTREFGVRLALGATPGRVRKLVLDYAVHIMLVGLLPGVFVAAIGSRLLESRIVRLMPNDITTWVVVPCGILCLGVLAALVPAWRASRIDPQAALRDL